MKLLSSLVVMGGYKDEYTPHLSNLYTEMCINWNKQLQSVI